MAIYPPQSVLECCGFPKRWIKWVDRARCQNVNKIQETIELGISGGLSNKKKITEDH